MTNLSSPFYSFYITRKEKPVDEGCWARAKPKPYRTPEIDSGMTYKES